MTGATAEEEEEMDDNGTTEALARSGVIVLARIASRTSLAWGLEGISLVRIARRAMLASLLYHHHQGGMKTSIRTRGWGLPGATSYRLYLGWSSGPSLHYTTVKYW